MYVYMYVCIYVCTEYLAIRWCPLYNSSTPKVPLSDEKICASPVCTVDQSARHVKVPVIPQANLIFTVFRPGGACHENTVCMRRLVVRSTECTVRYKVPEVTAFVLCVGSVQVLKRYASVIQFRNRLHTRLLSYSTEYGKHGPRFNPQSQSITRPTVKDLQEEGGAEANDDW